jgi:uncharacterized membrane protein YkgB
MSPIDLGGNSLFFIYTGVLLILIGIGIVSLLPLSEYAYMRQAGLNPPIAREIPKHQRRKRERRELGILLGIVGITTILGINPFSSLFALLSSLLGMPTVTLLMAAALILLIIAYRRKLHHYIRPASYQSEAD